MRSLLIPLTYVCLQTWLGTAQAPTKRALDKMPHAFDDQYIGCAEEMERSASEWLKDEKSNSALFHVVWINATNKWEEVKRNIPLPRSFQDEYGIAIVAYTNRFNRGLNEEVRKNWESQAEYKVNFKFKAFHYYLTRALQLLRGKCDGMYKQTVYRGVPDVEYHFKGMESNPIRFGHFASSSLNKKVAKEFAKKGSSDTSTFFTIHTCFGVDISKFSYNRSQEEVLIPVHEMFNVSQGDDGFVLQSTNQTCSYFNCAYLGREKNKTCVNNTATRGGVAFPGGMSPSLFGGSVILIHAAALKLTAGF
ncbi:ecto-ADP-ribosyltransferase 5-like isoform X2 [Pelodiscus sinensis]|uniref:ecto-ADP-ribosyltransferase 5-like isoform X2 n=1 Tax=Pelodiscus sinensis TaxID=13735 RepID=UPI003F6AF23F